MVRLLAGTAAIAPVMFRRRFPGGAVGWVAGSLALLITRG
jgi:hypothetical protein